MFFGDTKKDKKKKKNIKKIIHGAHTLRSDIQIDETSEYCKSSFEAGIKVSIIS